MRYLLALIVLLAGCSSTFDKGLAHQNRGNYQAAYDNYYACASEGVGACYNNIGSMIENGQVRSNNRIEDAVEWYTTAARYGVPMARTNLIRLGRPVPPDDLVRRISPEEYQMMMQLSRDAGRMIGTMWPR